MVAKFKELFLGILAYGLLGFYVFAVVYAGLAVNCLVRSNCQSYKPNLTAGFIDVLTTVGAVIAALVAAELAVTPPGTPPKARLVTDSGGKWASRGAFLYMLVWLVCGGYSFVVGYLLHPDVVPALTSEGKSWLALAGAAAYSYVYIKPT